MLVAIGRAVQCAVMAHTDSADAVPVAPPPPDSPGRCAPRVQAGASSLAVRPGCAASETPPVTVVALALVAGRSIDVEPEGRLDSDQAAVADKLRGPAWQADHGGPNGTLAPLPALVDATLVADRPTLELIAVPSLDMDTDVADRGVGSALGPAFLTHSSVASALEAEEGLLQLSRSLDAVAHIEFVRQTRHDCPRLSGSHDWLGVAHVAELLRLAQRLLEPLEVLALSLEALGIAAACHTCPMAQQGDAAGVAPTGHEVAALSLGRLVGVGLLLAASGRCVLDLLLSRIEALLHPLRQGRVTSDGIERVDVVVTPHRLHLLGRLKVRKLYLLEDANRRELVGELLQRRLPAREVSPHGWKGP